MIAVEPFVELRGRAGVERGERADDAGRALGDHQLGIAMMNSGEPMTGSEAGLQDAGTGMDNSPGEQL